MKFTWSSTACCIIVLYSENLVDVSLNMQNNVWENLQKDNQAFWCYNLTCFPAQKKKKNETLEKSTHGTISSVCPFRILLKVSFMR